jgi:hypothetical protein
VPEKVFPAMAADVQLSVRISNPADTRRRGTVNDALKFMGISPQVLCVNNPLRNQLRNRHRYERSGYNADTRRQVRVAGRLTLLQAALAALGCLSRL